MNGKGNRVKFHDVLSSVLESLAKGKQIYIYIFISEEDSQRPRETKREAGGRGGLSECEQLMNLGEDYVNV